MRPAKVGSLPHEYGFYLPWAHMNNLPPREVA